ncbi:MAG: PAS domain-containing protein [Nitrospirae bacterium]|nr:PAS domain-containing protein [Nitrospirota bacterium]
MARSAPLLRLEKSKGFYEAIINSLLDAIILVDRKFKIIFVNRAAEELIFKDLKEVFGRPFRDVFGDTLAPLIEKSFSTERALSGRGLELSPGRTVSVDFSLSPYFTDGTLPAGVIVSLREASKAEHGSYDYALDSLNSMLSSIAHEIKNPLGGIRGASQLLKDKVTDREGSECVALIIKEVDRLKKLLQELLGLSKRSVFGPTNIHEVIEQAVVLFNGEIEDSSIKVVRQYDPSLPKVKGDDRKLLQVFLNLLKNALEAMPSGGTITIFTRPSDEYALEGNKITRWALIGVKDEGCGIAREELNKIFFPFYTKKAGGTGLGLTISQKIIRDHGGHINVESIQGTGATFKIYIPFFP